MAEENETDPFCDKRHIINQVYYESKHTYVAYNLYPVVKGHSLIIPKRHVTDIIELKKEEVEDILETMKFIIPKLLRNYRSEESYDVVVQVGKYSGRSIDHLHIHIIPRSSSDKYQKNTNRIYSDMRRYELKHITTHEVDKEVKRLRSIFHYKPKEI